MTNCVQKITVTQKFNTQPIYVNPDPDGGVTILDNSEVEEARESYFGGTESTLQARLTKDFKNLNDKFLPVEEKVNSIETEIKDARTGYNGEKYDNLNDRINGDINGVLDKVGTVNYKGTTIHANNTYARNLVANRNKDEVLGQTIQNCLNDSNFAKTEQSLSTESSINVNLHNNRFNTNEYILKANTLYTFICDYEFKDNTLQNYYIQLNAIINGVPDDIIRIDKANIDSNVKRFTFTMPEGYERLDTIFIGGHSGSCKFKNNGTMILEGDWTNKEVSYIPFGLNYPETTEILEYGQNIFNKDDLTVGGYDEKGLLDKSIDYRLSTETKLPVFGQSNIVIDGLPSEIYAIVVTWDISGKLLDRIANISNNSPTKINSNSSKIAFTFYKGSSVIVNKDELEKVNINYGSSISSYQEYTERRINIDKPLASVSDSIRDRYYVKDGKKYHEQVVKEIVFDGSDDESWKEYPNGTQGGMSFYITVDDLKLNAYAMSDLFRYNDTAWDKSDYNIFCTHPTSRRLFFRQPNANVLTVTEWKEWLKLNNTKVLYELTDSITTEIETEDWYSFDSQTNITTTNTVKPTLDIDIPSDLNAVVSNLMVENTSLKQENQTLTSELENQKAVNEENTLLMNTILGVK